MDFEKILHKAQKNEKKKTKEVNCYRTTFSPPRKEEKTRGLSANIQKFLARREEDERKKKIDELRKKEELLALRNQDNKAKKRVQVMLKRTKSANKSVLDDAIDTVNTADTLNGPQQCDEDDYGYVSQEASKFYKDMMEKYNSVPVEEKKFSKPNNRATAKDLVNTKDRVKQALLKQEEDEHMPHKRKRRHKDKDDDNHDDNRSRSNSPEKFQEPEKPKLKRLAMPPPLDFSSLLKIAEKKQYEPVVIEKKIVKKEKDEPERLMTKKEKMEYEKQREREKKVAEYGKQSSSKGMSDNSPHSSYESRESSNSRLKEAARPDKDKNCLREIAKYSEVKSKEKERGPTNSSIEKQQSEGSYRPLQKSHHSIIKRNVSHSKHTPQSNNLPQSRSRSRSPYSSRNEVLSNGHESKDKFHTKLRSSPSLDRLSSSMKQKEDIRRNNTQVHDLKPSAMPRIPKITRIEEDRRVEGKYTDKNTTKEKEKIREREKEKERERQKEREKERAKERERDRGKEKERDRERERENERERLREKEKQLEREREKLLEMQRELERERERAKERERIKDRESEKERERRDRDCRESSCKRSTHSSEKEKPKVVDAKKSTKYDKLDLFGDRDSVSPEKISARHKNCDNTKKVKTERIKIVEDSTRDLFENPVTIVRKQSQNEKNKEKAPPQKPSSLKPDDKAKPSSSRPAPSDKDKGRALNHNDRKRDAEDARYSSDKRPRLDINSSNKAPPAKDTFKKPLPPKQFPPKDMKPKEFPPRDLQRKQFPPRDLQRKQFPPSDLKSRKFPPSDVRRGSLPRKRFEYERSDSEDSDEDEEDEYASDLDDFIDDGPAEDEEDYSKYIKDIFGYDKSKYRDDDEDIEESSFAEQMREECRSARLGLIEDLEDMAMEQREKRQKALMRMKRSRR